MSEKTKEFKIGKVLGPALGDAISKALGNTAPGFAVNVVKGVVENVKASKVKTEVTEVIKDNIVAEIAKSPTLINQMNMENPISSRTAQGGFAAAIASAWVLYKFGYLVPIENWNMDILYPALVTFSGGAWVLWGRLATGLPPAFSWITNKFSSKE